MNLNRFDSNAVKNIAKEIKASGNGIPSKIKKFAAEYIRSEWGGIIPNNVAKAATDVAIETGFNAADIVYLIIWIRRESMGKFY